MELIPIENNGFITEYKIVNESIIVHSEANGYREDKVAKCYTLENGSKVVFDGKSYKKFDNYIQ